MLGASDPAPPVVEMRRHLSADSYNIYMQRIASAQQDSQDKDVLSKTVIVALHALKFACRSGRISVEQKSILKLCMLRCEEFPGAILEKVLYFLFFFNTLYALSFAR